MKYALLMIVLLAPMSANTAEPVPVTKPTVDKEPIEMYCSRSYKWGCARCASSWCPQVR